MSNPIFTASASKIVDGAHVISLNDQLTIKVNGVAIAGGPEGADDWLYDIFSGYNFDNSFAIQSVPIASEVLSRGFLCGDIDSKQFLSPLLLLETWAPKYTVSARVNGFDAETDYIIDQQKSRTAYDDHGKEAWDPTNANDDFQTRGRGDYSVALDDTNGMLLGSGVNFVILQHGSDRFVIRERGFWIQIRIRNTHGRCNLRSLLMEAQEGDRLSGAQL